MSQQLQIPFWCRWREPEEPLFGAVTMCHGIGSLAAFSINGCYARTCSIRIMPFFVCHSDHIPFSVLQNSYRRCHSKTFGWFMHLLKRYFWNSASLHEDNQDGRVCTHPSPSCTLLSQGKTRFKQLNKFGSFSKRTIGQQRVARVINLANELFFFQWNIQDLHIENRLKL